MNHLRIAILLVALPAAHPAFAARITNSFDAGWRFLKADAPGAEKPGFDDDAWRTLSVPHDWSIEGPFDARNPTGGAGAFLPSGVGWYRKHFTLRAEDSGQRVFVEFDGVMANSDIWINGFHLGKRPYGYVSFAYELTGHVQFGDKTPNVLAVRADTSAQPASRWYTGAGIYRHVRLILTNPVHLEHWSTFVTTPKVAAGEATARVQTTVVNSSTAPRTVTIEVSIAGGSRAETKATTIPPGATTSLTEDVPVRNPDRWDVGHGTLYQALVKVREGKAVLDEETIPFGIREFHFDPDTGFWLNGRNFKIKGAALHHDGGAVGAAVPLRVWERRLELLRQVGVNAIRTAHNPPAPEFLDLCDRMGFLVMDEMFDAWTVAKNPYDYHLYFKDWSTIDTRDTVRRDRNHPSIILYSAGNEIRDTPKPDLAKEILRGLVDAFHANDPTRPVTQALFRPNVSHDYDDGLADLLDVVGQNYRENEILAAHAAKPSRKIVGTESQLGRPVWLALRDNREFSGQFLWAGFDYLGESRRWPQVVDASGLFDHAGGFKAAAYERQSWWTDQPMVHIVRRVAPPPAPPTDPGYEAATPIPGQTLFDDWTPPNLAAHEENIEVYSNCDEVELFLNGKSLGTKPLPADASPRAWRVPFEAGSLKAVARNKGKIIASHELHTAGEPAKIVLETDRPKLTPQWDDVAYITARVVDANGVLVPGAAPLVTFQAGGPGTVTAVDNGDIADPEPFQAAARHAFHGECIAIVRATAPSGSITVTASSPGLPPATIRMTATGTK